MSCSCQILCSPSIGLDEADIARKSVLDCSVGKLFNLSKFRRFNLSSSSEDRSPFSPSDSGITKVSGSLYSLLKVQQMIRMTAAKGLALYGASNVISNLVWSDN
ncbi:hypothetical protein RIR_jg20883.t1 [Rhizophagus irregularis DAOM 181602=DAOM 197198]|nr:hypothetical protein RIR_jg20883.t1 [Rhizophagus irregularis DAOM 181602=DAOM 197198]